MCSIANCERQVVARGWCQMHYKRWKRNGDPITRIREKQGEMCEVSGCFRPPKAHGLCTMHLSRWYTHGDVTVVKKGGVPGTKPERDLNSVCVACGAPFVRGCGPGRPTVTCSAACARDRNRAQAKAWYHSNTGRVAQQASRQTEHRKGANASYYEANRAQEIQRALAYARGAGREAKQARDAARFALTRGAPTAERFTLDEIFIRDGRICHLCGLEVDRREATMDHVIPVTKGGPHTRANVKLAHRGCNTRKGNRLLAA